MLSENERIINPYSCAQIHSFCVYSISRHNEVLHALLIAKKLRRLIPR